MNIIVCTRFDRAMIRQRIGEPEYSYYFVLREFLPLLRRVGQVLEVRNAREAEAVCAGLRQRGEACVFLHFTAPQHRARGTSCPVVPVFAWEFESIPTDRWGGNNYNDWRLSLRHCGGAITHSRSTVAAVKRELGPDFPLALVPAPVWDRCAPMRSRVRQSLAREARTICFRGVICDSRDVDFAHLTRVREGAMEASGRLSPRARWRRAKQLSGQIYRECIKDWLGRSPEYAGRIADGLRRVLRRPPSDADLQQDLKLSGVVYTSIFNPFDGRKNWKAMVTAFCWAFREVDDATLVIKVSSNHIVAFSDRLVEMLRRLAPFRCRVVVIKAFLEAENYRRLLESSAFYVNSSFGEGQCLPLMEFLSSGVPGIAPDHTGMNDYMSEEIGFVLKSAPELTAWQHDERRMLRTFHHRVEWTSLVTAFGESYTLIKDRPEAYRAMSERAVARMQEHCSAEALSGRLEHFLAGVAARDGEVPAAFPTSTVAGSQP